MSYIPFIKRVYEFKNALEEIIPCIEAYKKEKLTYQQKIKLLPIITKKLEEKYGVEKIIAEVQYVVHDIINTFHKMHQDFDNNKYTDCAIDFAGGIFDLLPGLKEVPSIISLGVEANKIAATNGAVLGLQSTEVAIEFVENTIDAACQVIEEHPFSTNTTHTEL